MITSYRLYRDARLSFVVQVLMPFLIAADWKFCESIYTLFARCPSDQLSISLDIVLRDLRTPFLADTVLAFLHSKPALFLSTEVFELLVYLMPRKPVVFKVIVASCGANGASCRALLVVERPWLMERRVPVEWKIGILGAIAKHSPVMPLLAEREDFGRFCTAVFSNGSADIIEQLSLFLHTVPVSDRLLWNFQKVKFFPVFVEAIRRTSNDMTVKAGIYIIDAFSRMRVVPEFLSLVPFLINRMKAVDATAGLGVLSAIAAMSMDPPAQAAMTAAGFHLGLLDHFASIDRAKSYVDAIRQSLART
jgi:hypothetical protein